MKPSKLLLTWAIACVACLGMAIITSAHAQGRGVGFLAICGTPASALKVAEMRAQGYSWNTAAEMVNLKNPGVRCAVRALAYELGPIERAVLIGRQSYDIRAVLVVSIQYERTWYTPAQGVEYYAVVPSIRFGI